MTDDQLPQFIQALLTPSAYQHQADEIKLIQTHISYVLLAGNYVYKIKKPLDFGFLDFTTLEKRKHFCEEELKLNRRLCPDIYLETLGIHREKDSYRINGTGEVVEYCVKMARMPEEKMMVNLINQKKLTLKMIDQIVEIIEPFYERAESSPEIDQYGTADAVGKNVLENFSQTEQFIGCEALSRQEFDAISSYARNFLEKKDIFDQRISAGKIRNCHGDLHSANICLADQVYIYDCIEFNHRFRYCDIASDLSFLAMDLDYNGLTELSNHLIRRYQHDSGDTGLSMVLCFYKCYRAAVRGKIGLFTAHEPEVDETTRVSALKQAARYFLLAQSYANACQTT